MSVSRDAFPLELVEKYNRPGPRYTSYPTAPHFSDAFGPEDYRTSIEAANAGPHGDLSLYVHLPFCQQLCYYCACHMRVTQQREAIVRYLDYVKREIDLVAERVAPWRRVVQIHWGGGTPTYLAPEEIGRLMHHLQQRFYVAPGAEVSIEADPRGLTEAHVAVAHQVGFNRISFGVQDFDPETQEAIHRVQPVEQVAQATAWARKYGFQGVSYDLVYGLPHQTVERFRRTVDQVTTLAPDRVSLFSYAHVPWKKRHQQMIAEDALPAPREKLRILLATIEQLTEAGGYRYIGMDHFARPGDSLAQAQEAGTMQRNFQGYSTHAGSEVYGFGVSAISQLDGAYAQNELSLNRYYAALDDDRPATMRGCLLNADDRLRRHVIMRIMCDRTLSIPSVERRFGIDFAAYFADALRDLEPLVADDLVTVSPERITVTDRGQFFIRNVAMPFDAYLRDKTASTQPRYSQTV
jgi:oxygen-independent coproporphyrinogen-3 oxidase